MRIIFAIFVSSLLLYSCNSECACTIGEKNVLIIETLYGDFATGNIDGVVAKLSPDIVWNEAENFPYADRNPYVGPDAVLEGVFARLGGEWNEFGLKDPEVLPVGANHVLSTGRYTGAYKSSGTPINAQFAHLWGLEDGIVVSFQQYTDTKQVADAMVVAAEASEDMD